MYFSLFQGSIWIWSIINLRYCESPDSVIRPFPLLVCEGNTSALESWQVERQAGSGRIFLLRRGFCPKNSQSTGKLQESVEETKTLVQKLKETIEEGVHNFKHHRIGFETPFVFWTIVIETALILGLFTWNIVLEKPNQNHIENDLKYRYIKMKGDASAEQIATLEDIFELNRNNEAIVQMREDVETYEEAVRKQAALAEQARLKEQAAKEQESKAKSIKNKQDDSKVNLNNKSKPWLWIWQQ